MNPKEAKTVLAMMVMATSFRYMLIWSRTDWSCLTGIPSARGCEEYSWKFFIGQDDFSVFIGSGFKIFTLQYCLVDSGILEIISGR